MVAHDFNNVLFAIRGYAELLAQDLAQRPPGPDKDEALRSVTAIDEAATRAAALTAQLQGISGRLAGEPILVADDAVAAPDAVVR